MECMDTRMALGWVGWRGKLNCCSSALNWFEGCAAARVFTSCSSRSEVAKSGAASLPPPTSPNYGFTVRCTW